MKFTDSDEETTAVKVELKEPQALSLYGTRAWLTNAFAPMVHLRRKMPKSRDQADQATQQQQKDYYLNFRLDHDAPGLIEYMAMYAAEVKNPQLNAEMIKVLHRCAILLQNPTKLAEHRALVHKLQNKPREQQLRL